MEKVIICLGLMIPLFGVSLIVLLFSKKLLYSGKHPALQLLLSVIWYILSFLSAPVGLLALWFSKIQEENYRKEIAETHRKVFTINERVRKELESEIESLKAQLSNFQDK